jgi:hypothetical protein
VDHGPAGRRQRTLEYGWLRGLPGRQRSLSQHQRADLGRDHYGGRPLVRGHAADRTAQRRGWGGQFWPAPPGPCCRLFSGFRSCLAATTCVWPTISAATSITGSTSSICTSWFPPRGGTASRCPDPTTPCRCNWALPKLPRCFVLAPLGVVLVGRSSARRRTRLLGCALIALALAFLTTQPSAWLWKVVIPLAVLQFPWRLHLPGTLLVAATGAMAVRVLAAPRWRRWRGVRPEVWLAVCAALALAATSLGHCRPLATFVCDEATLRNLLDLGYYTTSIQDEFRPSWANDLDGLAHLMRTEHVALDGVPIAEAKLPSPEQRGRFTLQAQIEHAGELRLPIFWFPGWSLSVDGMSQPTYPCAGTGVICTRVNVGAHVVTAAWRPTRVYHLGSALSLATLAGLVLFAVRRKRQAAVPNAQIPDAGAI